MAKSISMNQEKPKTSHSDQWLTNAKKAFFTKANDMVDDYKFDQFNTEVITDLLIYFGGFEGKLDLKKGLYLHGNIGSGKTMIMKIFRELMSGTEQSFRFINSTEIIQHYTTTGSLDLFYKNEEGMIGRPIRLCIDELGAEVTSASHYGTSINVLQEVLQLRYYMFQDGFRTHVTSNLSAPDVSLKYGDRVRDRMREMFNQVLLESPKSRRK
jgi:predicted ATPase